MNKNESYYEKTKIIDKKLSSNSTINEDELFELIKERAVGNYFFKKLRTVKWFYPLKEKDYFKSSIIAGSIKANEIHKWNMLEYLEKVAQQVNISGNEGYIDELFKIINNPIYSGSFLSHKGQIASIKGKQSAVPF